MNISEAFPSNYVKAADLNGKPRPLTIRTCVMEELGQGSGKAMKPVLYLNGAQKGLVLNKTNGKTIQQLPEIKAPGFNIHKCNFESVLEFAIRKEFAVTGLE